MGSKQYICATTYVHLLLKREHRKINDLQLQTIRILVVEYTKDLVKVRNASVSEMPGCASYDGRCVIFALDYCQDGAARLMLRLPLCGVICCRRCATDRERSDHVIRCRLHQCYITTRRRCSNMLTDQRANTRRRQHQTLKTDRSKSICSRLSHQREDIHPPTGKHSGPNR